MNLEQRKANLIYEIASLINDDPLSAPILIEELVDIMFDEQIDHIEDVIVNHFGVEVYGEDTCLLYTSPSPRDGFTSRMPSSA